MSTKRITMRPAFAAIATLLALTTAGCPNTDGGGTSGDGFNAEQRRRADQIVSVFENDTIEIQYAYIANINDGRGFTAGRAGFTTATGDFLEVVEHYATAVPGNGLAKYLPRLRELAAADSDATDGLDGIEAAWAAAANDARFRAAQDEVVDIEYYNPAVERWRDLGCTTALSLAAIYDTIIQHGEGDDPDGLPAIIGRASAAARGTPATGVSEERWLSAFLDARRATLAFAANPETREAWAESVDRVEPFRDLLRLRNFDLDGPIEIDTKDHQATIP